MEMEGEDAEAAEVPRATAVAVAAAEIAAIVEEDTCLGCA